MSDELENREKINEIIKRNFVIPKEQLKNYPDIFTKEGFSSAVFISDFYMILSFIDSKNEEMFTTYSEKIHNPFPGLIILSKDKGPAAFK
ncbi:MAG: hypothetical protein NWF07_07625, partial [Candidatus Bathyarchaeota archaeon]|nr:hypothetical protein [Candidatus Bathyarchaeota archaeon]